ncbi:MAG: peptidoglycan DD-metalloendopeptidase family protein [Bryobacterales bacterium]|nr:peptidoglycan DD-metalloendopeptidase family protein [Bryobacterales bacterium]MBV9397995.1 peptidoglycan DD-metalloendopeptidase family protein [Bryobacterales bacterium]
MKQHYFVVVLAHSLHGRLRRIHIPHQAIYVVVAMALFGSVSLFGMVSSYLRMTWKVANYNSLRNEVDTLRNRYQALQRDNDEKKQELVRLELMASQVSVAFGLQRKLAGADSIAAEGPLVPTYTESVAEYDFLKSAKFSRLNHEYAHQWQKNVIPSTWPVNGRLLSRYGDRTDPFSGEGELHPGVDISAGMGTPVHAAADGVVVFAEYMNGYGKIVIIDHGNGMTTRYAHLSQFEVVPGEEIRRGDVLALSGATGRVTSPHVHFEVRRGGIPMNPMQYLNRSLTMEHVQPDLPF